MLATNAPFKANLMTRQLIEQAVLALACLVDHGFVVGTQGSELSDPRSATPSGRHVLKGTVSRHAHGTFDSFDTAATFAALTAADIAGALSR